MHNIMHDNPDFYQLLFENCSDPILIVKNNQFINCNAATLAVLAYSNKQEFLTLGPCDISPPFQPNGVCSKEMAAEINARTLCSGFDCFEWTYKRSDGELIYVQVMLTVMVLNNEIIIHGVWRNIRAQQQLLSNNLKLSLEISELKSALLKQQNKHLTTINQRYKKSFELAPIGIIHLSLNGHFLEVNEGFCNFIGYSHEQLFALTITQLERPSCLPVFESLLDTLQDSSLSIIQEKCYLHKNGQEIWGRSTIKVVNDTHGQIDYVLQLIEDITQTRADQQQLIKLSQALEYSPSPVVITDLSGDMEYVNASFIALSGYSKEELLGKNQRILKSGKTPFSTYRSMFNALHDGQNWQGEFINLSKCGKEYIIASNISPIKDDYNRISHYLGVNLVISERRVLEQALIDSEIFTTSILDSLNSEIAVIDHKGIIKATNMPWRDFGNKNGLNNTIDSWLGINYIDYSDNNNDTDSLNNHFAISATKGIKQVQQGSLQAFRLEYPCHTDTQDNWFEMKVNALNTGTGDIIIQHNNINKFKHIEFELEAAKITAERSAVAKSEFLTTMSHEIRTPMNAIIGLSELASYHDFSPEALDYFTKINTASTSLLNLLNDILNLSSLGANSITLEALPFQLDKLLETLRLLFTDACSAKNLNLSLSIDENIPLMMIGDANRLQQILINLLGNAIKFTESGSIYLVISLLELQASRARLLFTIKDTGIGIANEHQHKLFLPFSQVDSSITRRYGGSGLGLSICNELLKLMTSELKLTSALQQGSTFSFELNLDVLPLNSANNAAETSPTTHCFDEHKQLLTGYKILVVEDNKINQQVVTEFLTLSGILVTVANNGLEALEQLAHNEFAAVLMDMHMPKMDGFETTQQLRRQARFKSLPILALSAGVTPEEQARSLAVGINEFIIKPIIPDQLLNSLTRWIQPQAQQAVPLSDDDLSLFDFENLLSLLGHNHTLLTEILQTFKDNNQSFLAKLNGLVHAQDRLALRALVHTLKGTSANVGAVRLHAAASALDAELKINLPDEARLQSFIQTFVTTMAHLDNLLKPSK